jgi:hypothetical protein
MEILTRASDENTRYLLDAYQRSWWVENEVLPENWLQGSLVPYTVIIDDTDPKILSPNGGSVAPIMERSSINSRSWNFSGRAEASLPVMSGWVRAADHDTTALSTNLYHRPNFFHDPTGLDRLDRCEPPLPSWLIAGLVGRFGLFEMRGHVVFTFSRDPGVSPAVIFRRARWVSDEETARLLKERHHKTEIPFISLAQFFAEPPPQGESRALWESEAGLFVRWGLFGPRGFFGLEKKPTERRQALVQFVHRARYEPVSETMFTECFGCGFGAMERILNDYLIETLAKPMEIKLNFLRNFPEPELKPATADQIGRILGDWLRMQGQSIHREQPEMSAKLLDAAGRILTRANKMDNGLPLDAEPVPQEGKDFQPISPKPGEPIVHLKPFVVSAERIHDPGLLAVVGLYEHDIGADEKARAFLEKAAKAGVVRPTAYLVLAQLRLAEAVAKPLGRDGKLSAKQADSILEPVKVALRSAARLEAWDLTVETLARCEVKPSSADLETIAAGVSQFPRSTSLALKTAELCTQSGNSKRAVELIDKSIPFVPDEDTRQKFQTLRTSLSASARSR